MYLQFYFQKIRKLVFSVGNQMERIQSVNVAYINLLYKKLSFYESVYFVWKQSPQVIIIKHQRTIYYYWTSGQVSHSTAISVSWLGNWLRHGCYTPSRLQMSRRPPFTIKAALLRTSCNFGHCQRIWTSSRNFLRTGEEGMLFVSLFCLRATKLKVIISFLWYVSAFHSWSQTATHPLIVWRKVKR